MAGGVSVAYVFVHLLPKISKQQSELVVDAGAPAVVPGAATELPLFLVALFGFTVSYGLEQFVVQSRRTAEGRQVASAFETNASALAFRLHVSSFALYNALVGYLSLHREESGLAAAALYSVAMALHFVVNDHGLREHHREAYVHLGCWIPALAVVGGFSWAFSSTFPNWPWATCSRFWAAASFSTPSRRDCPRSGGVASGPSGPV